LSFDDFGLRTRLFFKTPKTTKKHVPQKMVKKTPVLGKILPPKKSRKMPFSVSVHRDPGFIEKRRVIKIHPENRHFVFF